MGESDGGAEEIDAERGAGDSSKTLATLGAVGAAVVVLSKVVGR